MGNLGGGVAHAVAEVEGGGVVAAAELKVGALGRVGVVGGEFGDAKVDFAAEAVEYGSRDWALSGGEDDESFSECGGADDGVAGAGQRRGDLFGRRFVLDECDECRGVDDQESDSRLWVIAEDLLAFLFGDRRLVG